MSPETNKIKCPRCGLEIDVSEAIYKQLSGEMSVEFNKRLEEKQREFDVRAAELKKQQNLLEKQQEEMEEKISKGIREKMIQEKKLMEGQIREAVAREKSEELNLYKEQLMRKSEEVKELNKTKAELLLLRQEKEELAEKLKLENEIKLNSRLAEEKEKMRNDLEKSNEMKIKEKQLLIEQLTEQLKTAQRKAEQGSMQAQGEVQELAIEEWLRNSFPFDDISEVKKGARGADCIQVVNTRTHANCGSIYYESKRTKDFQQGWIDKFKDDMRAKGATFGVLVTDTMPKDMDRFGLKDGIWICSYEEFKGLCHVLRESVILLYNAAINQENKGDKMSMLYDYLTGSEFRMQIEAIVEGFSQMHTDLNAEKRAMESIWKKREKQIEKVLLNTNHMYSSIRGIAGKAIAPIQALELPDDTTDQSAVGH